MAATDGTLRMVNIATGKTIQTHQISPNEYSRIDEVRWLDNRRI